MSQVKYTNSTKITVEEVGTSVVTTTIHANVQTIEIPDDADRARYIELVRQSSDIQDNINSVTQKLNPLYEENSRIGQEIHKILDKYVTDEDDVDFED